MFKRNTVHVTILAAFAQALCLFSVVINAQKGPEAQLRVSALLKALTLLFKRMRATAPPALPRPTKKAKPPLSGLPQGTIQ